MKKTAALFSLLLISVSLAVISAPSVKAGPIEDFFGFLGGAPAEDGGQAGTVSLESTKAPMAYYAFEGNLDDSTGNENHAKGGYTVYYSDAGKVGKALTIQRGMESVSFFNSKKLLPKTNSPFSASFWVEPTGDSYNEQILAIPAFSGGVFIHVDTTTERMGLSFTGDLYTAPTELWTKKLTRNTWSFVTVTFDGSCIQKYFNGQKDGGCIKRNIYGGADYLGVGIRNRVGKWSQFGYIDEVKIWNRALSADEVYQEYSGKGGCVEDWACTEWSACVNGQQTRTCTDNNDCGTSMNKPGEIQGCCTPDCGGKECGDDGCGGTCGTCAAGTSCVDSSCVDNCIDSDNDGYNIVNVAGSDCGTADCNDSNANVNPGHEEVCHNGIDDNCNGETDEDCGCLDGDTRACGNAVGECTQGTQTCAAGAWGECTGGTGPSAEACDNKDNDCDGAVDEGLQRQCGTTDVGACSFGTEACSAGLWTGCNSVEPTTEYCSNSRDDDCDGVTDEPDCSDECSGCIYNQGCIGYGLRMKESSATPKYCDLDRVIRQQKDIGAECQNNFECLSNQCSNGGCVGLINEVRGQTDILWNILCTLLNPMDSSARLACISERSLA